MKWGKGAQIVYLQIWSALLTSLHPSLLFLNPPSLFLRFSDPRFISLFLFFINFKNVLTYLLEIAFTKRQDTDLKIENYEC
jgi:hypothetical protein